MDVDETITLCIMIRASLQLNNSQINYCVAEAIQCILIKYFTLQVLAVKTHSNLLINDTYLKTATSWLSSNSRKSIFMIEEGVWDKLKTEFNVGKNIFYIKNASNIENTLVLWPTPFNCLPSYIKELNITD